MGRKIESTEDLNTGQPAKRGLAPQQKTIRRKIDAIVAENRRIYGGSTPIPGVLISVWDGSGHSYQQGYGVADLATQRSLRTSDAVRIGSITKSFVTEVLFQLEDEGKLSLEDPIGKFDIGISAPNANLLTLRDLAQMRSGLPEFFDPPEAQLVDLKINSETEMREMLAAAFAKKPFSAPGQNYDYCNANYLLLGLVVESVTHRHMGAEIEARILTPHGLTGTRYPTTQETSEPWARGYVRTDDADWADAGDSISVLVSGPAGAMTSDLNDMARWARLLAVGKDDDVAAQAKRLACLPTGIGNIDFGVGAVCSAGWIGYTGGLPGYNTAAYYAPAAKATIVVFVTAEVNEPLPGVANAIFSEIAGLLTPCDRPLVIPQP